MDISPSPRMDWRLGRCRLTRVLRRSMRRMGELPAYLGLWMFSNKTHEGKKLLVYSSQICSLDIWTSCQESRQRLGDAVFNHKDGVFGEAHVFPIFIEQARGRIRIWLGVTGYERAGFSTFQLPRLINSCKDRDEQSQVIVVFHGGKTLIRVGLDIHAVNNEKPSFKLPPHLIIRLR